MPSTAPYMLAAIPVAGALCGIAYSIMTLWCAVSFRRRRNAGNRGRLPNSEVQELGRRPLFPAFTPPVSILKPLCGVDPHSYESLRSHFVQDYPTFEIIFGVSDASDEIVPMLQRVAAEFPKI